MVRSFHLYRLLSILLIAHLFSCNDGNSSGPSQLEKDQLEQLWTDPGKADLSWCGTTYSSEYTNMVLNGWVTSPSGSETFTLFAGWHAEDFPWPDARNWVSIGLRIGDRGYNYLAYKRSGFNCSCHLQLCCRN